MAAHFFAAEAEAGTTRACDRRLIPEQGPCPSCRVSMSWGAALLAGQTLARRARVKKKTDDVAAPREDKDRGGAKEIEVETETETETCAEEERRRRVVAKERARVDAWSAAAIAFTPSP